MPFAIPVVPARRRLLRQGGALLLGASCGLPALAQTPAAAASPADGRPITEFLYAVSYTHLTLPTTPYV